MATSFTPYDSATKDIATAAIGSLAAATLKVMICDNTYTPNRATHAKRSDITGEVVGTGYTAGGKAYTTPVLSPDTTNHLTKYTADDLAWAAVTFTNGRYAVIYNSRGGASSADELIGWIDFGANQSPAGVTFTISMNASGWFALSGV